MGRELLALGEVLGYREEKKRKEMERVVSRAIGFDRQTLRKNLRIQEQ